ncbi:MAG: hypothetical protein H6779_04890 [Candidatus Nomurabacteria bacterium]|nr:hypothetical protein [Candidatus Nomurabacteria bacterium]USN87704.1 MAG: hypothetical protein H6779_04890 [Candidatus Nomurabacteria bacterium]
MNCKEMIVLPGGNLVILRNPSQTIPDGFRLATHSELLSANLGYPFPWGNLPNDNHAFKLWQNHKVGMGGLVHHQWFVTSDGRFGGADNVPKSLPGSLRCSMYLDGGAGSGEENEGYALVKETDKVTQNMYRGVQLHALEHVVADGGHIIVSPVDEEGVVYVGFVGRCMRCPNPEMISFRQLQKAVPDYYFELFPEWENWSL